MGREEPLGLNRDDEMVDIRNRGENFPIVRFSLVNNMGLNPLTTILILSHEATWIDTFFRVCFTFLSHVLMTKLGVLLVKLLSFIFHC